MTKAPHERILFIHAHPDDETIATGGTIATLVDAGSAVTVLTCTRGERGEVVPPEFQHLSGDKLGDYRVGELAEAMRVLGVADSRILGASGSNVEGAERESRRYRDSGMQWGANGAEPLSLTDAEIGAAETLTSAPLEQVVKDVLSIVAQVQPTAIVSYNARGGYGHPDHIRAHDAALTSAIVSDIPFFEIVPDSQQKAGDLAVDVMPVMDRKKQALRAYRTQLTVVGDTIVHSGGQSEEIAAAEIFRHHGVPREPGLDWAQLGLFAKIATILLVFAGGVLVGVVGTANHQIAFAAVSLLIAAGFVLGLRLLFGIRTVAVFAALGILLAVGVLSLRSAGGSVLVQANNVGYLWTYAVPLITLIVLAWPSARRPSGDTMKKANDPKKVVDTS